MVRMKNKVMRFPQPRHDATKVPSDDSMTLFSLGGRRFAIQWIVTEVAAKPAEVIDSKAPPEEEEAAPDLEIRTICRYGLRTIGNSIRWGFEWTTHPAVVVRAGGSKLTGVAEQDREAGRENPLEIH